MKTKYILFITIFVLAALRGQAQRFDWVKTYCGVDGPNGIKMCNQVQGSTVDSLGNLYFVGEVTVCNNSDMKDCLGKLIPLFDQDYINIISNTFSPVAIASGDCFSFQMTIDVMQFLPSTSISFRILDDCNHCSTDFIIDLLPESFDCEMEMWPESLKILNGLSNSSAAYFDLSLLVPPAQNLLSFWSVPPMVVNYNFYGIATLSSLWMIDLATLSQLSDNGENVCFYAITCDDDKLCLRHFCIQAKALWEIVNNAGIVPKPDNSKSDVYMEPESDRTCPTIGSGNSLADTAEPGLLPNPTSGEVSVINTTDDVVDILVLDMNGRQIATFENTVHFNITHLASGSYIVRIISKLPNTTEKIAYLKLIKK